MKTNLPLKWHGGKAYLANRIVALMPKHLHYVEPYAGGLAVLLAKDPEGVSEVANDLNGGLTNFWRVLQDPVDFDGFRRLVEAVPFSEVEWEDAEEIARPGYPGRVQAAANFFIRCRQSLAGRMDTFTGITRTRTRRRMSNEVSAWLTAVEGLPAVHARLKRVLILDRPALDVIRQQDGPDTLFYLDPPYLHETRATTGEYGPCEMTESDHVALLSLLAGLRGKWILSGYPSAIYDSFFKDFPHTRHDFDLPNNAAGGKTKRRMTECVWCSF
jgi:DNA adenine methylase